MYVAIAGIYLKGGSNKTIVFNLQAVTVELSTKELTPFEKGSDVKNSDPVLDLWNPNSWFSIFLAPDLDY